MQRIEDLHPRYSDSDHCQTCGDPYPCPTLVVARQYEPLGHIDETAGGAK